MGYGVLLVLWLRLGEAVLVDAAMARRSGPLTVTGRIVQFWATVCNPVKTSEMRASVDGLWPALEAARSSPNTMVPPLALDACRAGVVERRLWLCGACGFSAENCRKSHALDSDSGGESGLVEAASAKVKNSIAISDAAQRSARSARTF
jgi:hypothetical protein